MGPKTDTVARFEAAVDHFRDRDFEVERVDAPDLHRDYEVTPEGDISYHAALPEETSDSMLLAFSVETTPFLDPLLSEATDAQLTRFFGDLKTHLITLDFEYVGVGKGEETMSFIQEVHLDEADPPTLDRAYRRVRNVRHLIVALMEKHMAGAGPPAPEGAPAKSSVPE